MKKIVSLFLICTILISQLSACSYFSGLNYDRGDDATDDSAADNNSGDNATDDSAADNNSGDNAIGDTDTNDGDIADIPNNEDNKAPKEDGIPIDKESDLIKSLINLLYFEYIEASRIILYLDVIMRIVRVGHMQPLEVVFDPLDYYFVCGYFNKEPNESYHTHILAENCDWYRFNYAENIPEYKNGEKNVFIFQVNRAASVVNLLENDNTPKMENFSYLQGEFEKGYNITPAIDFNETIIYLQWLDDNVNKDTVYHLFLGNNNRHQTMRYVEIDGVKYTPFITKQVTHEGEDRGVYEISPERELGVYYDDFKDVIETDIYIVELGYCTDYYSCIKIDDVICVMKKYLQNE